MLFKWTKAMVEAGAAPIFCHAQFAGDVHTARRLADQVIKAALSAAPSAAGETEKLIECGGWMPIESAPKDWDKPILAYNSRQPMCFPVVVRWVEDDGESHWCDAATASGDALHFNENFFDYWRPIGSLPASQRKNEGETK